MMFDIRYANETDRSFWFTLDEHISESEFLLKVRDKRGYIILDDETPIGIMRYNLFWDIIPCLTFIYIVDDFQKKGLGKRAMQYWENTSFEQPEELVLSKVL